MFINEMSGPDDMNDTIKKFPTWTDVKLAITQLNGANKTMLSLNYGEDTHMIISGGKDNSYLLYATYDNETFFNLHNFSNEEDTMWMIVGGQEIDLKKYQCVNLETALMAAKSFAEKGELADNLNWVKS